MCKSLGRAYQVARPGDRILVGNGRYGEQKICRGGTYPSCNPSARPRGRPAITFLAESRHGPVIHGLLELGDGNGANPPSYVTFDGIDQEGQIRTYFASERPKATNITIRNGHIWQLRTWENRAFPLIQNAQVDNFTISHQEVGPACCSGDLIQGGVANANVPKNMIVRDSVMHDIYDDCEYVPAAVNAKYGPCTNPGDGTHVDGIHMWGGVDGLHLLRNRWYAIGANGDPVGQTIFLESDATGVCAFFRNIEIVNNAVYAGATQNNTVSMGLSGGSVGCSPGLKNVKILYNTVWGEARGYGNISVGGLHPGTSVVIAGNIVRSMAGNSGPNCPNTQKGGGNHYATYRNNLISDGRCHSSDRRGVPRFVRADPLRPDQHLKGAQWALGHGEKRYAPKTDLEGRRRPLRARPDIGAFQHGRR